MASAGQLVFVKLGGSLITDKQVEATARLDVIRRLSEELKRVLDRQAHLRLVLGHGSGSFGPFAAQRYQVQKGCTDWHGYALTSAAAMRLNRIVTDTLLAAGVPVVSIQPSASIRCRGGKLAAMAVYPIQQLLTRGLLPLVYGDVALDELWGSTIASTEAIFAYLARALHPQRILLLGEVEGVYSVDPRKDPQAHVIPIIHAARVGQTDGTLGGSHGVDVTGGMHSKVHLMLELVRDLPGLTVQLVSGLLPGLLERVLLDPSSNLGTRITV